MEAKDTQLQQKDDQLQQKDGQIQRQATELRERTLRQQRELQTLRVREWFMYGEKVTLPMLWLLGEQRKAAGGGRG